MSEEFVKNDIFKRHTSSLYSGFEIIKPKSSLLINNIINKEEPVSVSDFEIIDEEESSFDIISSEEAVT